MKRFFAVGGALVLMAAVGAAGAQQAQAPGQPQAQPAASQPGGDAIALQMGQSLQSLQTAMAALDPEQLHVAKREKQAITEGQASVGRNLAQAMPALLGAFSEAPGNLGAAFRLYRDGEAVLAVAQRSADVIPGKDDENGGAALRASASGLQESLQQLGNWMESQGRANFAARQQQVQAAHAAAAAAAAPPPATLVIQDANTAAKKSSAKIAQKKKAKKPAPTIPHGN